MTDTNTVNFLIRTEDADYVYIDDCLQFHPESGEPLTTEKFPVYFEKCLGDGKAKYWTKDITKAFRFDKLNDALSMLTKFSRSEECEIITLDSMEGL